MQVCADVVGSRLCCFVLAIIFFFIFFFSLIFFIFFFNDTATTEIYTLSLHDGSSDLLDERNTHR